MGILPELKASGSRVDGVPVASLTETAWVGVAAVMVFAVLAMLHALGAKVRNERLVAEMTSKAARLRARYRKHTAEPADEEIIIVDEAPAEDRAAA
jgi:hypothetical protein